MNSNKTKKKNIALVHYSYPPVIGGVEFIMEAHAKQFAQAGHQVKIITGVGRSVEANISIHRIKDFSTDSEETEIVQEELRNGFLTERFGKLKNKLKKEIQKALGDISVCFVHNVLTMHFNMALTAAFSEIIKEWGEEKDFYIWCHDASLNNPDYQIPNRGKYPWKLLQEVQPHGRYITISSWRKKQLSELFGVDSSSFQIVPNGVDLRSFLGITDFIWQIAQDLDLFHQEIVLFFPSRILRRKNYELAIHITHALNRLGKKSLLLLTGPPDPHNSKTKEYLSELCALIKKLDCEKEVIFIHNLKEKYGQDFKIGYSHLQALYSLSDILLLPSSQEGFGIPLLEAASKKLPIACSNIASFTEVTKEHTLLFNLKDDPYEIAQRIIDFLNSQPTYHLFKKIMKTYSWEAIYENYLKELVS